jgi:Ser/Thr protein kinase RdoA (MazF antagonist)
VQPSPTRCTVYRLSLSDSAYAVKLFPPEYASDEVTTEVLFAQHLRRAGLPVPAYLATTDGAAFATAPDGHRVAVYEWIDEKSLSRLSDKQLRLVIGAIAAIHTASRELRLEREDAWLWTDTRDCLAKLAPPEELREWIEAVADAGRPWSKDHELYVCHNDFCLANTIWNASGDAPSFIDFTNTILAPLEWDVAVFCGSVLLSETCDDGCDDLLPRILREYTLAGGDCNSDDVFRLAETALVQRGIFTAFTQHPAQREQTWQRLGAARSLLRK